jgi:allantoinase
VGYGGSPPDPKWPGGARLALNFVMNYEEGSEPSIDDGDGYTESGLTEGASLDPLRERRDLGAESMFEYDSRVGFWRVLRIFRERDLPMTVFGCALALESHQVS